MIITLHLEESCDSSDSFEPTLELCCPFFHEDDFYLSQKNGIHQLQLPSKASWSCQVTCFLSVNKVKVAIYLDEADKQ